MITMDTLNSSKTRAAAVNDASVASTSTISKVRLDTTLYNYVDIGNNIERCSVHR